MRGYLVPAIEAALDDPADPPADDLDARATDRGDPLAWLLQPAGTDEDGWFDNLASPGLLIRFEATRHLAVHAPADPRTVPTLIDRLERDPEPEVRRLVASRVLPRFSNDPRVLTALQAAADRDNSHGVRWAARYALRLRSAGPGRPNDHAG